MKYSNQEPKKLYIRKSDPKPYATSSIDIIIKGNIVHKSTEMKDHRRDQKQGRHLHRQPDAYELYELEHMPRELIKSPSNYPVAIGPRQIYVTGVEAQPYWRPMEGANGVIFRPDYYESERTYSPTIQRDDEGDCNGDVNCEAEKFIALEHAKFEQSKWTSMKE